MGVLVRFVHAGVGAGRGHNGLQLPLHRLLVRGPELEGDERAALRCGGCGQREGAHAPGRALRDQLIAHFHKSDRAVWVAVENRGEDEPDQYWIGRATRIEKTYEKEGSVAGTGGRVRYDIGDVEIEVEWFRRDVSGGDERRVFGVWKRVVDADGKVVDAGRANRGQEVHVQFDGAAHDQR